MVSAALDADGLAGFNDAFVTGSCESLGGIEQEQDVFVFNIEGHLLFNKSEK
jgi:hypothetical protein